jgi:hypothetical protein
MNDLQALQHQLEEARDEAELNLLQLQQVQEELEFYFLRCQELEQELGGIKQAEVLEKEKAGKSDEVSEALERSKSQLSELQRHRQEEQQLLNTAQTMLEGQARYLEDVSLREEQAAQANDRSRLLEAEILYYLRHSKPLASLDPSQIARLIKLAKKASPLVR